MKPILVLVLAAAAAACTSGPPPPIDSRPYEERLTAERAEKDFYLRTDPKSPLLPEERPTFTALPYFPIDPTVRVPASLREEPTDPPIVIKIPMSSGTFEQMRRVGSLRFSIGGESYTLTAFADADVRVITRLFVPFADLTSGTETYKGGRYLDLDRTSSGLYDLDFNRAYHPYCVYNPTWVCPVPPRENHLPIPIRAGERLPPQ